MESFRILTFTPAKGRFPALCPGATLPTAEQPQALGAGVSGGVPHLEPLISLPPSAHAEVRPHPPWVGLFSYFFLPILMWSYLPEVAIHCSIGKEIFCLYGDNFILNYFSGQTLPFNKGLEPYTKSIKGIKITY